MTQVRIILYGEPPIEVTIDDSLTSVGSAIKKAIGDERFDELDTKNCRLFINGRAPIRWVDSVPENCQTITLNRLITITVIVNGTKNEPFDVLQGTTITEALLEGGYDDIVPQHFTISVDDAHLSLRDELWDLHLDDDTTLRIEPKPQVIPLELEAE